MDQEGEVHSSAPPSLSNSQWINIEQAAFSQLPFILGASIKNILETSPCVLYKVNEDDPIISAGLHLSQLDIEGVVAVDGAGKPTGVILGYNVLRLVDTKSVWSAFYQTRIADSKMRVLLAKPEDDVQTIIQSILHHGWGYAIAINPNGAPTNLIGLLDIAQFLVRSGYTAKVTNVRARDKASNPLISISETASVMASIQTMLDKHVRRLFVTESELVVSDRGIIKWLLSPANLGKLRDAPGEVLSSSVKSLGPLLHKPVIVEKDLDAAKALQLINREDARCLITDDRTMILTPWDLTVSLIAK
jgi:CBS domain-containing protein